MPVHLQKNVFVGHAVPMEFFAALGRGFYSHRCQANFQARPHTNRGQSQVLLFTYNIHNVRPTLHSDTLKHGQHGQEDMIIRCNPIVGSRPLGPRVDIFTSLPSPTRSTSLVATRTIQQQSVIDLIWKILHWLSK